MTPSSSVPESLRQRLDLAAHRGDRDGLLQVLLDGARRLSGADRAALVRPRSHEGGVLLLRSWPEDVEISTTAVRRSLEKRATVVAAGPALTEGGPQTSARRLGLRWVASLPLPCGTMALYLDSRAVPSQSLDSVEELLARVAPALTAPPPPRERSSAAKGLHPAFSRFVGASTCLREALEVLDRVATTDLPVLLLGETGTGKELAARALHAASRRTGPLVAENCAALPVGLVESELFGSARGAFTGAERDREGLLRAAHRGTLFLDEVGDMPGPVQAKLLRVLQEGEVRPLGKARAFHVDLRVVSATSSDIAEAGLRDDLLYRLAAVTVRIPSLRERRGDVPVLARHFLRELIGGERRFTREALRALGRYAWPGNVRQLRFEVERAAALATGRSIGVEALSEEVVAPPEEEGRIGAERRMIEAALRSTGGQKARAAAAIGWSRPKLYRRMEVLGIPVDFGRPRVPRDH